MRSGTASTWLRDLVAMRARGWCCLRVVGILWPIRPTQLSFGPCSINLKPSCEVAMRGTVPARLHPAGLNRCRPSPRSQMLETLRNSVEDPESLWATLPRPSSRIN